MTIENKKPGHEGICTPRNLVKGHLADGHNRRTVSAEARLPHSKRTICVFRAQKGISEETPAVSLPISYFLFPIFSLLLIMHLSDQYYVIMCHKTIKAYILDSHHIGCYAVAKNRPCQA